MPWVTNFQPNVDAYREAIVAAMNQYDNDPTDANWEQVKTAFDENGIEIPYNQLDVHVKND